MIGLDTNILIYMLQAQTSKNISAENEQIQRAEQLNRQLDDQPLALPAPVIAEYLVGIPSTERAKTYQVLQKRYVIKDFNAAAALVTASLPKYNQRDFEASRPCIKVDTMIAAIAIVHGISTLYTHDINDFNKILDGKGVKVSDLPPLSWQNSIFDMMPEDNETE